MPEEPSVSEQIIRSTYTAPTLIGEGSASPLLDRARDMVDEDFPTRAQRRLRRGPEFREPVEGDPEP
jgi:hypothetical protein